MEVSGDVSPDGDQEDGAGDEVTPEEEEELESESARAAAVAATTASVRDACLFSAPPAAVQVAIASVTALSLRWRATTRPSQLPPTQRWLLW